MSMAEALSDADKHATLRDAEAARKYIPNLAAVDREVAKAPPGHAIVITRDVNMAPFTQNLSENIITLCSSKTLSNADELLMYRLSRFVTCRTNEIVLPKRDHHTPTNDELAAALGYGSSQFRSVLRSLISKGIVHEIVDTEQIRQYGHAIKERMLMMNPELFVFGDKNQLEMTLCRLHIMSDKLERNKVLLPWKIWYRPDNRWGRLYRRDTYLQRKKESAKGGDRVPENRHPKIGFKALI
jgi:hypothetical protein